jgi:ankyrin repeat protein
MIAASRGHTFVVEQLLKDNADVAAVRNNEATALIYAVGNNQPTIVTMLLAAGADPNERMKDGLTPLNAAALFDHHDIAQLLLEAKAKPEQRPTLWDDAFAMVERLVGFK